MIRRCGSRDFTAILDVINDGAEAYRGVIPADRWHEPYMPAAELRREIAQGVEFWGFDEDDAMIGVMGTQPVDDVTLIRHAYVRTARQREGIGGRMLARLRARTDGPVLIGTWAAAAWAVDFYRGRGFELVTPEEKDRLLRRYWSVPERQIEESVVLADERWFARAGEGARASGAGARRLGVS